MFKVILKTALKTLLGVIVALAVAFAVASLGFPASMASFFESCGNYSFAAGYANLSYKYSGNIEDLDRCFYDSMMAGDDGNVIDFGDRLIKDEGFDALCERRDTASGIENFSYRQYIYGKLCVARYEKGNKDGAVSTAVIALRADEGFPVNNAVAVLTIKVAEAGDGETAKKLLEAVEQITPKEGQQTYYNSVKTVLSETQT